MNWGVLSEYICDLSIAIILDAGWDPTSLCAPNGHLVPQILFMDNYIPFIEGKGMIIDVPVDARGTAVVYIDDTISLTLDVEDSNNVQRLEQATLLVIHFSAQEKHNDEPIPREEMAARPKLLAEAGAEEIKIIMGWILNFRTLTIAMPEKKYVAWKVAILEILEAGNTSFKELEQMIGRLVHLGIFIPSIYHFMSRLRELLRKLAKREKDKSEHQFDRRSEINVVFIGVSTHWGRYEPFGLQKTNKRLQIRFMPCRLGQIQQ